MGKLGVAVRIVGGEDESIRADEIDHVLYPSFVRFHRNKNLTLKVLTGRHRQILGPDIAFTLPAFVESPKQPGKPSAVGFQKGHAKFWMARQDAPGKQADQSQHLLHGLSNRSPEHKIGLKIVANLSCGG